jgi:hypothetical protein
MEALAVPRSIRPGRDSMAQAGLCSLMKSESRLGGPECAGLSVLTHTVGLLVLLLHRLWGGKVGSTQAAAVGGSVRRRPSEGYSGYKAACSFLGGCG